MLNDWFLGCGYVDFLSCCIVLKIVIKMWIINNLIIRSFICRVLMSFWGGKSWVCVGFREKLFFGL